MTELSKQLEKDNQERHRGKGWQLLAYKKDDGVIKLIRDGKAVAWFIDEDIAKIIHNGLRMWLKSGKILAALQDVMFWKERNNEVQQ